MISSLSDATVSIWCGVSTLAVQRAAVCAAAAMAARACGACSRANAPSASTQSGEAASADASDAASAGLSAYRCRSFAIGRLLRDFPA